MKPQVEERDAETNEEGVEIEREEGQRKMRRDENLKADW